LFGAEEGAALEDIEKSYMKVSEKYDPNEVVAPPDSSAVFKASYVHAEIRKAFQKMKEKEKKKEVVQKAAAEIKPQTPTPTASESHQSSGPAEKENPIKAARELFVKANYLYKKKMYTEAATLLQMAMNKDNSKANYYLLLGICQSKIPTAVRDGERNLHKAAEMEPWNADPLFALGELYRSENMMKKAKAYFKKALAINMDHALAGKAVDEMGGVTIEKKSIFSIFGKK
jgi:tetratricopeptide (TPR) repeat protein